MFILVFAILLVPLLFVVRRVPIFGWVLTAGLGVLGIYLVVICPPAHHSSHGLDSHGMIELGYQLSFFGAVIVGLVSLVATRTRRAPKANAEPAGFIEQR
jgi:hypothetical protein